MCTIPPNSDGTGGNCNTGDPYNSYLMYIEGHDNVYDHIAYHDAGSYAFQNYCSTSGGTCIETPGFKPDRNVYRNSTFVNMCKWGYNALVISVGDNVQFYNNLIYNSSTCSSGIESGGQATNAKIYNNVIYNSGVYGIYLDHVSPSPGAQNWDIKNNIIFGNTTPIYFGNSVGVTYSNNLCSASGTGCSIIQSSAPNIFSNPSGNDYHLKSGSPAINAGATPAPPVPPTTLVLMNMQE